jgi:hypothetical protein
MGALHSWRCYPDTESAATAVYSLVPPVLTADGLTTVEYRSGSWVVVSYTQGVEVSSVPAPALSFVPCDPADSVAEGLLLGGLIASVWAAGWAVSILRRAL